jgi:sterol desaturase/sphingolipid hydroxylase (fatty acid hydroxylase superfamily)
MLPDALASTLQSLAVIVAAMIAVAGIEAIIPLRARGRWNRAHLGPNLALTAITFGTNAFFNIALLMTLVWLEGIGFGLLRRSSPPRWLEIGLVVLILDLSFYVAHVAMHKIPGFWRFHSVHHSDPVVDVTTTIRQHPGEGVIRYAFLTVFAVALGASPAAFAVYRTAVALSGLLEHANVRLPGWLDRLLSRVVTWPTLHKVHHSRDPRYTDTNYGNIVCWWDRAFGTFTPARYGTAIDYGLDGHDDPDTQTTVGLLALPFRDAGLPVATEA